MAFQGRKLARPLHRHALFFPLLKKLKLKLKYWLDLFIGTLCFSPLKSVLAHQFAFFRYVICALNVLYKAETGYSLVL